MLPLLDLKRLGPIALAALGLMGGCRTPGEGLVFDNAGCTADNQCGAGLTCQSGQCLPSGTTNAATSGTSGSTDSAASTSTTTMGGGGATTSSGTTGGSTGTDSTASETTGAGGTSSTSATTGAEICEPSALVLLQRSGAMVQPIDESAGSESWWDYIEPLLTGSEGVVEGFGDAVSLGVGTFYMLEGSGCPNLEATPFSSDVAMIGERLATAKSAALDAVQAETKSDSPVAAAIDAVVPLLSGQSGAKYLVLVVYGFPDSCNGIDNPSCFADEVIFAVQQAKSAGITTIPILLGGPGLSEDESYEWYGQAVANAGQGNPVGPIHESLTPSESCPASSASADYSGSPGGATLHHIDQRDEAGLTSALSAVLSRIESCE